MFITVKSRWFNIEFVLMICSRRPSCGKIKIKIKISYFAPAELIFFNFFRHRQDLGACQGQQATTKKKDPKQAKIKENKHLHPTRPALTCAETLRDVRTDETANNYAW